MSEATAEYTTIPLNDEKRFLRQVGISAENLQGKTVLDVGAGEMALSNLVKTKGIDAKIISYDSKKHELLNGYEKGDAAVVGDFWEELPFADQSFDTIINVGGPLRGGPWDDISLSAYKEGLRVLKDTGEIRTTNPFMQEGGIFTFFYIQAKEGNIYLDDRDVEEDYGNGMIDQFDDDGFPEEGSQFWSRYYADLTREEQTQFNQYMAEELADALSNEGIPVVIELKDMDPKQPLYVPYMVMKKKV